MYYYLCGNTGAIQSILFGESRAGLSSDFYLWANLYWVILGTILSDFFLYLAHQKLHFLLIFFPLFLYFEDKFGLGDLKKSNYNLLPNAGHEMCY